MVRIAGVNLPNGKHADIALMYLYGVGRPLAITILDALGIEKTTKIDLLPEADLDRIRDELKKYVIEGDLRREVSTNIKRFQEINRGQRHKKRLPVRGQRTKTNARTRKGKAVAIAGKKK